MKKNFLLLLVCVASITVANAKDPITFNFENGLPATITKYCNDGWQTRFDDAVVVDNPSKTGRNTSNKVLKFNDVNGQLQWQGFKFKLDTPIPLAGLENDSITKVTVKYYETTPYERSSNPSVKLLLTWNGQYYDNNGELQGTYAQYGTDNAGGAATDINPWAVNGVLLPSDNRNIDHQQQWDEVEYAFNAENYGAAKLDNYYKPTTYKEIVGIAISPVRGYGTPETYPYTVLIDDITIHFKSGETTSIKNATIASGSLNVNVNGDLAEVSFISQVASATEISVYNVSGQLLSQQTVACSEGANKVNANVSGKGVYVVKVKSNNQIETAKFVK